MGENHFAPMPVALYGVVLLMTAIAYTILVRTLIASTAATRSSRRASASDVKGMISLVMYIAAIGLAFVNAWISLAIYFAVAMIWFIPDRRFETLDSAVLEERLQQVAAVGLRARRPATSSR